MKRVAETSREIEYIKMPMHCETFDEEDTAVKCWRNKGDNYVHIDPNWNM